MGDGYPDLNAAAERLIAGMRLVIDELAPDHRKRVIEAIRRVAPGIAERLQVPSAEKH